MNSLQGSGCQHSGIKKEDCWAVVCPAMLCAGAEYRPAGRQQAALHTQLSL